MNQNFSFATKHGEHYVEMLKSGEKDMTSREKSEFRDKCNVGDIMHCFFDMQSGKDGPREKLFDVPVIERYEWQSNMIPRDFELAKIGASPRKYLSWYQFALKDGFLTYNDFLKYFIRQKELRQYTKKQIIEFLHKHKIILPYYFKKLTSFKKNEIVKYAYRKLKEKNILPPELEKVENPTWYLTWVWDRKICPQCFRELESRINGNFCNICKKLYEGDEENNSK